MKNIDYEKLAKTRDSRLPDWGPYSKEQSGIAHINDKKRGSRVDFAVFPSLYRSTYCSPSELYPAAGFPWYAETDHSFYTYRFEVEWKDRVYADVSYLNRGDGSIGVKVELVNNSDAIAQLVLHYLASRHFPASELEWVVKTKGAHVLKDAVEYDDLYISTFDPRAHLTKNALLRGEVRKPAFYTNLRALGGLFGAGCGDRAKYTVKTPAFENACLTVRASGRATLALEGIASGSFSVNSEPQNGCEVFTCQIGALEAGEHKFELISLGGEGAEVDCFVISEADDLPAFERRPRPVTPELYESGKNTVKIAYPESDCVYGIAWQGQSSEVREIKSGAIDDTMCRTLHDHVRKVIGNDPNFHYTDVFIRPIVIDPRSSAVLYGLIATGSAEEVDKKLEEADFDALAGEFPLIDYGDDSDRYAFSQRLMKATELTNVVFPIYLLNEYIRHFTPGKWWNSLYTWDHGFIEIAMADISPDIAIDGLNCYLPELDNPHAAFTHNGSVVPVQAFAYKVIFDRVRDVKLLKAFYERLRRYYRYFAGKSEGSVTDRFKSGLLNTFPYFYNSGGWDDYPPQVYVHKNGIALTVAPVVSASQAIKFANILKAAAEMLGYDDIREYDADIKRFADALQRFAYDPESGYFGYVVHDGEGNPTGILRAPDGSNFNMGLDGAYPFIAGIATPEQAERIVGMIMNERHMWTPYGISTVDKSASYFRRDGYWNGAIWMPHQWFVYDAMLDCGRSAEALKIAKTALELWKSEVEESYFCYEHFIVESGRGAGWHRFGGLSSPVVTWYYSLMKEGLVTVSTNTWKLDERWEKNGRRVSLTLKNFSLHGGSASVLVTMPRPEKCRVLVDGRETPFTVEMKAVVFDIPCGTESRVVVESL